MNNPQISAKIYQDLDNVIAGYIKNGGKDKQFI